MLALALALGLGCAPAGAPGTPSGADTSVPRADGTPVATASSDATVAADAAAPDAAAPEAASPPADEPAIVDRPIRFDDERRALTLAYRRAHEDPAASDVVITPRMIVLHYTGGGSGEATWKYFDRPRIEKARALQAGAGEVNVSAHFIVERDGTIWRLLPETTMARHTIGLNHVAIGVENVGDAARFPLTEAQVQANARLVRHLRRRFPTITHLIGHHEYRAMEGHPYFVERDPRYRNRKGDPGPAFMMKVRALVADLGLEGPPPAPAAAPGRGRGSRR